MQIDVRSNVAEVRKIFAKYPEIMRKATVSALNRTAEQGKSQMARRISKRRHLKMSVKDIRGELHVHKANSAKLISSISISGSRIPLERFVHKVRKRATGVSFDTSLGRMGVTMDDTGVMVNVIGQGYHGPARKFGNKGFVLPNGSGQIWVRTSKKRYPITRLSGPSLPSAISAHKWEQTDLDPRLETKFYELLESQLRWRLRSHMK